VLKSGALRRWGLNAYGNLGDGSTTDRSTPGPDILTNVASVAAGLFHTCAILKTGKLRCWGMNQDGQLGDGTVDNRVVPIAPVRGFCP